MNARPAGLWWDSEVTTEAGPEAGETPPPDWLTDVIETILLGGPRTYTRIQVEEITGFPSDNARQLWRSMGFAEASDDAVIFTDADIAEIERVAELQRENLVADDTFLATTRFMGQTFAQLASWEGQLAIDRVIEELAAGASTSPETALDFAKRVVPLLEQTHAYVWRRQLAAYLVRKIAQLQEDTGDTSLATIGFADISGYTALTRQLSEMELHRLLENFEATATFAVGSQSGRVVKMIGDAVLFSADSPAAGAEIALSLLEMWEHKRLEGDHPAIKIGVAAGPVVSRLGDVFGSTVNIAARLTSIGRPGWVLVDRTMSEALADNPAYRLKSQRPQEVRGFHRLQNWRLQRPEPESEAARNRSRDSDRDRETRRRKR